MKKLIEKIKIISVATRISILDPRQMSINVELDCKNSQYFKLLEQTIAYINSLKLEQVPGLFKMEREIREELEIPENENQGS